MDVDNMQAVIDAARLGQKPHVLETSEHFQILSAPHGVNITTLDLEKYNFAPFRKKGTVTLFDAVSMNTFLTANAIAGATTIYINPDAENPAIVAVINGNGTAGPGHADFRASIAFRPTPQWVKWRAIDGKLLPQEAFAEFCEDNLGDISAPDGATVMEIVSYLQATRTADFKSGIKLSNGLVQFTNIENIQASVGSSEIAVPDTFTLGLAPIFGVAPFNITARFRYRIEDRKLKLGIKLQRIEDTMHAVVQEIEGALVLPEGTVKVYGLAP